MSQISPMCRLYNPDSAIRCDCGYDFASGTMKTVGTAPPSACLAVVPHCPVQS